MDEYEDRILDHNYDGIQEFDNPMPGWWKAIFVLTVIWAGVYLVGIELNILPRYGDDLKAGQAELAAIRMEYERAQPPLVVDEPLLMAALADVEQVVRGREVYATHCASCHGAQGQGGIGPNLTDDHWIYGQAPLEIYSVIRNGAENGMPAWDKVLLGPDLVALVAFVGSVRGNDAPDAKAPQGERYERLVLPSAEAGVVPPEASAPTP